MSEAKKKVLLSLRPIIISNNNTKKMVIQPSQFLSNAKLQSVQQYKDEVIYSSTNCDFLKGESQHVLIVNRMNLFNKSCRTVARCTSGGNTVETTSDNLVSVIGQKNFETVLSALSSIFNEETKVRGILALLSVKKIINNSATQTNMEISEVKKDFVSTAIQTDDSRFLFLKDKQRKRIRRQQLTPYVVTDNTKVKKCIIKLNDIQKEVTKKRAEENLKERTTLPELKEFLDEDSNISSVSNISASSWPSLPGVLEYTNEFLHQIDKVTDKTLNSTGIKLRDGSIIMIPVKPEDVFHIATPEVLKNVTNEERMKLIWHQAFIDFKLCLEQDEDGYYPLHVAVLNNDVDLVRRQCASLRARHESVDIPAAGLTALHMAVRQNVSISCTNILLQNGADPLLCDHERRCSLHLAADQDSPQLRTLLAYCDNHARSVLKNNQDLWRPEFESKSDTELTRIMYHRISELFDDQGYSPLMTAAEAAIPSNVALLATRAGSLVDAASPDCGATALYRTVARACLHAKETGNMHKTPEKYLKTIEVLVEHGADPSIYNHCGSSVNTLLTEFNLSVLSMTIANKMTALKHGKFTSDNLNMILYKHSDGRIGYKDINNVTNGKPEARTVETGLHAVITVDMPKKNGSKKDTNVSMKDVSNPGQNETESVKGDSGNSEVNEVKLGTKGIQLSGDIKVESVDVGNILSDSDVSYKVINTNKLTEVKSEGTKNAIDNKNPKMTPLKIGNIIWKPNTDVNLKATDINKVKVESTKALKMNFKEIKDGNLGNVTFKRLSSGQMIAITQSKCPKGIIPSIRDKKISLIKIPKSLNTKDIHNTQVTETSPNKTEETTRSAKERKTENVVIVENVAVKSFPIQISPGTSKTAKAKDIVISPKPRILNDDIAARELTMEDISPKIIIGKEDVETVKKFRKRKLRSE